MFCAFGMSEPELEREERQKRVEKLLQCYRKFKSKGHGYAYKFLGLELFNLLNAAAQMVFLDKLMGGRWIDYGLRLWDHYSYEGDQLYQVLLNEPILYVLLYCISQEAVDPDKFLNHIENLSTDDDLTPG